jgi:hypothetical protein
MGSTGDPSGQPGLAPRGSVTSPRREAGGRVLQPRTTSARLRPICTTRRTSHCSGWQTSHCSGWRVLLTANADAAEAVPGSSAATYPPAEAPADGGHLAASAATAGALSRLAWHRHHTSETAAGGPSGGGRGRLPHQHSA